MCSIRRIDAFLEKWPDAEFGPGHIVLADCNLEDHNIDWCIGLAAAALGQAEPTDEDRELLDRLNWYREDPREELEATLAFLREFRAIPEAQRVEPGDHLCECIEP